MFGKKEKHRRRGDLSVRQMQKVFTPTGRLLEEHRNASSFQSKSHQMVDIRKFYQGCGHVVYQASLYFHNGGTNRLMKSEL